MEVVTRPARPALGGIEKAFSNNVLMRIADIVAGRLIIDIFGNFYFQGTASHQGEGGTPSAVKHERKRIRSSRRSGNRVWGPWDILPPELLVSILIKLSIMDYLAFSGVCKTWRSASIDFRKYCMDHQQPLVVVGPKYAKKACVLYNMFDEKKYKTMLPDLPCKKLLGLSCGYLITIDKNLGIWLVNLLTKHELRFPVLPRHMSGIYYLDISAVLFQSTRLSRTFLVLFSMKHNFLMLSESGASNWQRYPLSDTEARISDVKIFDGKIFVLTSNARFGEFNPMAGSVPKLYKINIPFQLSSNMSFKLVASENKLLMIVFNHYPYFTLGRYHSLFEIDHKKMDSVEQILDLGEKSLFFSRFSSAVVDTTGWGAGNCVCLHHAEYLNKCSFFNLNGNRLATYPVVWDGHLIPHFWFFPSESWSISCVSDAFGT